jgi:hypothetical protein
MVCADMLLEGDGGQNVEADQRRQRKADADRDEIDIDASCGAGVVEVCHEDSCFGVQCSGLGAKKNPRIALCADTWVPEIL